MSETDREFCLRMMREHPQLLENICDLVVLEAVNPVARDDQEFEVLVMSVWHTTAMSMQRVLDGKVIHRRSGISG
jgi:hypothetical protein